MSIDGKILVVNGANDSATKEIYHTISEKMSNELESHQLQKSLTTTILQIKKKLSDNSRQFPFLHISDTIFIYNYFQSCQLFCFSPSADSIYTIIAAIAKERFLFQVSFVPRFVLCQENNHKPSLRLQ